MPNSSLSNHHIRKHIQYFPIPKKKHNPIIQSICDRWTHLYFIVRNEIFFLLFYFDLWLFHFIHIIEFCQETHHNITYTHTKKWKIIIFFSINFFKRKLKIIPQFCDIERLTEGNKKLRPSPLRFNKILKNRMNEATNTKRIFSIKNRFFGFYQYYRLHIENDDDIEKVKYFSYILWHNKPEYKRKNVYTWKWILPL